MTIAETSDLLELLSMAYPRGGLLPTKELIKLWHTMLSDMPGELAEAAVRRLISTSPYPPTIADVRRNAADAVDAANGALSANDAWGLLMRAIRRCGVYRPEDAEKELPPEVWAIAKNMGWTSLCMSDESNVATLRAQFERAWNARNERRRERMIVPASVLDSIRRLSEGWSMELPEGNQEPCAR